jgi:hypothetical protein
MKKVLLVLVVFALIFAVVGCNNGSSGSLKPFAKFGPEEPDPPPPVNVTFGDGAGESPVALTDATRATFTIAGDKKGFTIAQTNNGYGNGLAYFKVDFGDKKLGDYKTITFNFATVGTHDGDTNDIASKPIDVYSNTDVPSGYISLETSGFVHTPNIGDLTKNDEYTLDIPKNVPGASSSAVYFIIGLHCKNAKYTVSNVLFE